LDYFRNLRADASLQFLKAIKEKNILNVKINSYENIKKLADSDSIRFTLGDITEIDAKQSKLEAYSLLNEVIQQEADWESALYAVNSLIGNQELDSLYLPIGELVNFDNSYKLPNLISIAQENRSDLKAALQDRKLNQDRLKLIKAERKVDLGLSIGVGHATIVNNTIAPTPAFTSATAGIAIPLKFSNKNKGELKTIQYTIQQSEIRYKAIEINTKTEVSQAFKQFQASQKQVKQFDTNMLQSAQHILDGKTYSYQRGETSLLEVLNAQRTFNEVQESYYEAQYAYGISLIELQRVVGIWDFNL
jgi:cobalt-zinc-cadmium efflux system outer membrane protein